MTRGLSSLDLTRDGLSVEITRPGAPFDVAYRWNFSPTWGTKALSGFVQERLPGPAPFVLNFSDKVSSFQVDAGDFSPGDTDVITVQAYSGPDGHGRLVDSETLALPDTQYFSFHDVTLHLSAPEHGPAIRSVTMVGGGRVYPNSVFFDNITVTPETHGPDGTNSSLADPDVVVFPDSTNHTDSGPSEPTDARHHKHGT